MVRSEFLRVRVCYVVFDALQLVSFLLANVPHNWVALQRY
jgi:hypothetical protein